MKLFTKELNTKTMLWIFGGIVVIALLSPYMQTATRQPGGTEEMLIRARAIRSADDFVTAKLKAPSTAKFPDESEDKVYTDKTKANVYYVKGYVDSQNSFGAMLREKYICEVKNDNGHWVEIETQFTE